MKVESHYQPVRFQGLLDDIKKSYPLPGESFQEIQTEKAMEILHTVSALENDRLLLKFAARLKSTELSDVLPALQRCDDPRVCGMLLNILEFRFRKKLYELNWALVQTDFENANLLLSMARLAQCLRMKYAEAYAASIFASFEKADGKDQKGAWTHHLPVSILGILVSEKLNIQTFCVKYSLDVKSSLMKKVNEAFFAECEKESFIENRLVLTDFLRDLEHQKSVPVVANYLKSLEVQEYFDEVNYFLIEQYGDAEKIANAEAFKQEETGGNIFYRLPDTCLKKLVNWQGLKRIEAHFGGSKKYRFWASLADKMVKVVRHDKSELLLMDFGSFVAADVSVAASSDVSKVPAEDYLQDDFSYIYDREYFEQTFEGFMQVQEDGQPSWRIIPEHVADARERIILDIKSEVYRMGYEKAGLLYSKEIIRDLLEKKEGYKCS